MGNSTFGIGFAKVYDYSVVGPAGLLTQSPGPPSRLSHLLLHSSPEVHLSSPELAEIPCQMGAQPAHVVDARIKRVFVMVKGSSGILVSVYVWCPTWGTIGLSSTRSGL